MPPASSDPRPEPPETRVLAVDLDGTLLQSDLLFETLWAGLARDGVRALGWFFGPDGRAGLKRRLAATADLDVTQLPYAETVIDYIRRWRAAGGRAVLITASDSELAQAVAEHLGLFDAVHGSDGQTNLKGATKAAFLARQYGQEGYVYMGDAQADLPVWAGAAGIVTVNAGAGLRRAAERLGPPAEHLRGRPGGIRPWLRALRPHQWAKNILVFVPMVASHAFELSVLLQSLGAFIAFSLMASSVYVTNDLLDLAADRAHPRKRFRPLASGAIPIASGSVLGIVLLLVSLAIAALLGWLFFGALVLYYATTTAYSLYFKRRSVIDIWLLANLYTLRILAGAAATTIVPSAWLMAFAIFLFFSLAAVKRLAELVDLEARASTLSRRGYDSADAMLVAMMAISSGYVSILVLALYVRTPSIEQLYSFAPALLGICLVLLYWISRMVMVTHRGQMHDDPLVFALRDRVSQICILAMFGCGLVAAIA